jgi:hypothetical protein
MRRPVGLEQLAAVVDELIEVLQLQARELEELIARVGQVTVHLPEESKVSVIRSALTGLRLRVKELRGVGPAATREGGEGPGSPPGK